MILLILGTILGVIGFILLVADNTALRGEVKVAKQRIADLREANKGLNAMLDRYQYKQPFHGGEL